MFRAALKKLGTSSSLAGSQQCNDEEGEEVGTWMYLITDMDGIRPRTEPSYSRETKSSSIARVQEGTVVRVDCRRRAGWTRWLRLANGLGWIFDVSPKDNKVRAVEVEVVSGEWQYAACVDKIPIMSKPSLAQCERYNTPSGKFNVKLIGLDEIVDVRERIRPVNGKGGFLRLADGSGYVLDFRSGRHELQKCMPATPVPLAQSGPFSSTKALDGSPDDAGCRRGGYNSGGYNSSFAATAPAGLVSLNVGESIGQSEYGDWNYAVVDPAGVTLRSIATCSSSAKLSTRIGKGEIVRVVERVPGEGFFFLRLENPHGWAFDTQQGSGTRKARMVEVDVERGEWTYRVCAPYGVAFRSRCTLDDEAKIGAGPGEGSLLEVVRRVKLGDSTFLRVKDGNTGGGWVFDRKLGRQMVEGPIQVDAKQDTEATVEPESGVYLRRAPTESAWAQTSMFLLRGAKLEATRVVTCGGQAWVQVSKPGGNMDGWVPAFAVALEARRHLGAPTCGPGSWSTEQVRQALHAPSAIMA